MTYREEPCSASKSPYKSRQDWCRLQSPSSLFSESEGAITAGCITEHCLSLGPLKQPPMVRCVHISILVLFYTINSGGFHLTSVDENHQLGLLKSFRNYGHREFAPQMSPPTTRYRTLEFDGNHWIELLRQRTLTVHIAGLSTLYKSTIVFHRI